MKIPVGVVSHYSRRERAEKLVDFLNADVLAMDYDGKVGAGRNHEVCYEWLLDHPSDSPWVVVVEDDAVPVKPFRHQLGRILKVAPSGLVSLYLGRARPPHYQTSIAQVIATDAHFLMCNELLHHVAVAIKRELIPGMLSYIRAERRYREGKLPIDEAIGAYARSISMPVAYAHPSIVNHNHLIPTAIKRHASQHPADDGTRHPSQVRKAWAFGTRKMWLPTTVDIPEPKRHLSAVPPAS